MSPPNETYFEDADPISIFALLNEFRSARDSIAFHVGVATWQIPYHTEKPASSPLKARLLPKNIRATGLHDERMWSDVEVVKCLLTTYAAYSITRHAIKKLEYYR